MDWVPGESVSVLAEVLALGIRVASFVLMLKNRSVKTILVKW